MSTSNLIIAELKDLIANANDDDFECGIAFRRKMLRLSNFSIDEEGMAEAIDRLNMDFAHLESAIGLARSVGENDPQVLDPLRFDLCSKLDELAAFLPEVPPQYRETTLQ